MKMQNPPSLSPQLTLKRHLSKFSKRLDGRNLDQLSEYHTKLERCQDMRDGDNLLGRWEVAVQNRQNAVYGELILPLDKNEERVQYNVRVIGNPFEGGSHKFSLLLNEILSIGVSQDQNGITCKITLQIFEQDGNIESCLIRTLMELISAALHPQDDSFLLQAELEAFIQLQNNSLVRITDPSAIERQVAESVLLRCITSSGVSIVKTLKPGLMLL